MCMCVLCTRGNKSGNQEAITASQRSLQSRGLSYGDSRYTPQEHRAPRRRACNQGDRATTLSRGGAQRCDALSVICIFHGKIKLTTPPPPQKVHADARPALSAAMMRPDLIRPNWARSHFFSLGLIFRESFHGWIIYPPPYVFLFCARRLRGILFVMQHHRMQLHTHGGYLWAST
jgi:hypothetical protein